MRFFGNLWAWALASIVGYVCGSIFSTQFVLSGLSQFTDITLQDRINSSMTDLVQMNMYLMVIAIGFAIAFFVASLVKAVLPFLSAIAYPVAGAAAIWLALTLMFMQFDVVPIIGAQSTMGFIFQLLAGAIGGLTFEFFRPKGTGD